MRTQDQWKISHALTGIQASGRREGSFLFPFIQSDSLRVERFSKQFAFFLFLHHCSVSQLDEWNPFVTQHLKVAVNQSQSLGSAIWGRMLRGHADCTLI